MITGYWSATSPAASTSTSWARVSGTVGNTFSCCIKFDCAQHCLITATFCAVTRYTDMESEDYPFFQGLVYLLENDVSTLGYELTFSTEVCLRFLSVCLFVFCEHWN